MPRYVWCSGTCDQASNWIWGVGFIYTAGLHSMSECAFILACAVLSLTCSFVLVLHHRYKHANSDLTACQKWFQLSDVCNCKTWNHEQFVVVFAVLSVVLFVASQNCG